MANVRRYAANSQKKPNQSMKPTAEGVKRPLRGLEVELLR